jgi:hypothetical protein
VYRRFPYILIAIYERKIQRKDAVPQGAGFFYSEVINHMYIRQEVTDS